MEQDTVSHPIEEVGRSPALQNKPASPWGVKVNKRLKIVTPNFGKLRPAVGQCCHRCTPDSLGKNLGQKTPSLGFQNVLAVDETRLRYRGWLVRRVCCVLFVSARNVYPSPAGDRLDRVCQSIRVQEALSEEQAAPAGPCCPGPGDCHSPYRSLITTCISPCLLRFWCWLCLKTLGSVFSVQINLNHLPALQPTSPQGSPLVYVSTRQSILDYVLIPLVLFSHNLRVPYTFCPHQMSCSWLRSILEKLGVVFLPNNALTEDDAEADKMYSPAMTAALSISVCGESGRGGQWLARFRQVLKDGAVPDVSLVPVGISYDCIPSTGLPPFSLKEMCATGRYRVDGWRPLQELLLPAVLHGRTDDVPGEKMMSWILPSHYAPELVQAERNLSVALTMHLLHSTTSFMAVMATGLVASLLVHRHRKGVLISVLCRDVVWLVEELLFRNKDVGFGGSLAEVVCYAVALLRPQLIVVAHPSSKEPFILPRPSMAALANLSVRAQNVTHSFIAEAVGACAVSAMLCEVAGTGVRVDRGDMEFDVALCHRQLTQRTLQLCHLLPPGFVPPCQSSCSFALDAVDSLVGCGVLVIEEIPRASPRCDIWNRSWPTSGDPYQSDSDSEPALPVSRDAPFPLQYASRPPEGAVLGGRRSPTPGHHTYARCVVAECVARIHLHLRNKANQDKHYESCTEEAARRAVRTLTELGVLVEEQQDQGTSLVVSPLFQLADNRLKLQRFISQYLYR
ncbi:hypothetical protein NHX12_028424 [Muraenolepis orangiensis]|uniref:GPAT/DHAPAT C-terminal domain-containing protein n=1 Tax=Muraenolepis orangiensis TaxID=630683 RepID=A0A9Q0EDZ8_9TELE|nr:hypothetical protein NHX12_028424 [Muraenolepis orangiensis]